jgi:hypothetical protein
MNDNHSCSLKVDPNGDLAPEGRASLIAELVRFMATRMEPVPYGTLLAHVINHFGAREELVSFQVMHAVHVLASAELLSANTFYSDETETALYLQAETVVGPSRRLTDFAFRELVDGGEE